MPVPHLQHRAGRAGSILFLLLSCGLIYISGIEWPTKAPGTQVDRGQAAALEAEWGIWSLKMSQAFLGSGTRMKAFLSKLEAGQPVKVGVMGGSITVGHGAEDGDKTWSDLVFEWIRERYPHPDHQFTNGAVPATACDYFSACYQNHVDPASDLYIVETALNDKYVETMGNAGADVGVLEYTEILMRELLSPNETTAAIMLSTWASPHGFTNGADKHNSVSEYYDIPRLTTRGFLYKYLLQYPDQLPVQYGSGDFGHPNARGHVYMAALVIYYLEGVLAEMRSSDYHDTSSLQGKAFAQTWRPSVLPPLRIGQLYYEEPRPENQPFCLSANTYSQDGNWGLAPSANTGFEQLEYHDKRYWVARKAGARITFSDIMVHGGDIGLYYHRSYEKHFGDLYCWVEGYDQSTGKLLEGQWEYVPVGSYGHVRHDLSEGLHTLTCESRKEERSGEGGEEVRIIAILSS